MCYRLVALSNRGAIITYFGTGFQASLLKTQKLQNFLLGGVSFV